MFKPVSPFTVLPFGVVADEDILSCKPPAPVTAPFILIQTYDQRRHSQSRRRRQSIRISPAPPPIVPTAPPQGADLDGDNNNDANNDINNDNNSYNSINTRKSTGKSTRKSTRMDIRESCL